MNASNILQQPTALPLIWQAGGYQAVWDIQDMACRQIAPGVVNQMDPASGCRYRSEISSGFKAVLLVRNVMRLPVSSLLELNTVSTPIESQMT